jgi:S1-C subfamily serine protease
MATPLQDLSAAFSDLVAKTAASVVSVHSKGARSAGFVWKTGLIVTADDALAEEGEVRLKGTSGGVTTASIVGRDPTTDIALLRTADIALPPVTLSTTTVPAAGSLALAVGADDGAATAALGIVSLSGPAWRSLRGGEIDARIELDARLRRRNEGAVAIDAAGQVFGMAVFGPRRRVVVIPAATIARVAARLETHGRIPRGYLGLSLQPVAIENDGGTGAMVVGVDAKGPAAAAGIHQGDVLISWNGTPISGVRPLLRGLGADSVGRKIAFELRRGGQTYQIALTVGERPAD